MLAFPWCAVDAGDHLESCGAQRLRLGDRVQVPEGKRDRLIAPRGHLCGRTGLMIRIAGVKGDQQQTARPQNSAERSVCSSPLIRVEMDDGIQISAEYVGATAS